MIPNQDENGIRFTLYRADAIDADVLQDLLYTHGTDLSYADARTQEIAEQRAAWEDECEAKTVAAQDAGTDCVLDDFEPYLENFEPMIDEPVIEGQHEGVAYRTTWLGGALHLWIFCSPIVGHFALCSPCAPGACNGDERTSQIDGYMGYDILPHWRWTDPEDCRTFADRIGEYE